MPPIKVHDRWFDIYLSEALIQAESGGAGAGRSARTMKDKKPLFIAILNGAFMFAADSVKHLTIDAEICFIKAGVVQRHAVERACNYGHRLWTRTCTTAMW
jgi:hypoxanthine phosphoribosyltransferase